MSCRCLQLIIQHGNALLSRVRQIDAIIFISASFAPSNVWLQHQHFTRLAARPTSLCHQTERFLVSCSWYRPLARIVAVNIPHHVTQRGNAKQHLLSGCGTHRLSRIAPRVCLSESLSVLGDRLMFRPCSPGSGSPRAHCPGRFHEANSRTLRLLLECRAQIQWTRLAGRFYSCPSLSYLIFGSVSGDTPN